MKLYKITVLVILLTFFLPRLQAQSSLSGDSALVLTPAQEASFLAVEKQQSSAIDSLNKLSLGLEQRKQALRNIEAVHDEQLKKFFTIYQWACYEKMLQARIVDFKKHAREKKIEVVMAGDN